MSATSSVTSPTASGGAKSPLPVTRIEPSRGWVSLRLGELWDYRELLFFLGWRDVTVRYKQTVLGASWAIIQPVSTMIIFSIIFGRVAKIPSDGIPYPLFTFVALVPWTLFSYAFTQSANSVVLNQQLITKIYFPRLAIPIATVLSGLVDFVLAFAILLALMVWYGVTPTARILWVVPLVLLALVSALGVGLWLSALNVQYRDVRYIVPFLSQLWLVATPIAYPSSMLDPSWRALYALNPLAGVVEWFRWALLGSTTRPGPMIAVSALAAVVVLVGGALYFRRMESTFADII